MRKALFFERMFEALERRSKERAIVAALAKLAAEKTIDDESFESEKAAKQMAEAISKESKNDNLVYNAASPTAKRIGSAVFSPFATTAPRRRPSSILTLFHSGELREIRRLMPDLEAIKAPFKLKIGEGESHGRFAQGGGGGGAGRGPEGRRDPALQGTGRDESGSVVGDHDEPGDALDAARCRYRVAEEAEEMFSKLMGDQVEPRRQFIEENALNVRNLDI